ncbi:MAG: PmoA family protein [Phycisphaerae bacterium]
MHSVTRRTLLAAALVLAVGWTGAAHAAFTLEDTPGKHMDVLLDGKPVARYMVEHDTSSKERHHETYKPYLHILDPADGEPITKGPHGKYTHHRGLFIGWSKLACDGKRYDFWHMSGGDIVHQKFLKKEAGPDEAVLTSLTHWITKDGKTVVVEARTMRFLPPPTDDGIVVVDFVSTLKAPGEAVDLQGDPEHAGMQYRPHNGVAENKSAKYLFPKESITSGNVKNERDLPWAAETYELRGKTYSVQHMNHPSNPKETRYSAYRDYGRFGAFFEKEIPAGESLTVRYRILIRKGDLPPRDTLQKYYEAFAGK